MKGENTMKQGIYIEVRVGERLKKYIEECYRRRGELKNGTICPKKGSSVRDIMMPYIETHPHNEEEGLPQEETIRISIPIRKDQKVYNSATDKVYYCDTFWRHWLSSAGHKKMERLFENNFRFYLFAHLDGYIKGQTERNPGGRPKVKHGLYEFCDNFHIDPDRKDVQKLLRAYYRYLEDREQSLVSPFFF